MGIIENVKELAKIFKQAGDIEHYEKIIDLQGNVLEIMEENVNLKKEIDDLTKQNELIGNMTFRKPFWYMEGDDFPHCAKCWEDDKKTIHLTTHNDKNYYCPKCKNAFIKIER